MIKDIKIESIIMIISVLGLLYLVFFPINQDNNTEQVKLLQRQLERNNVIIDSLRNQIKSREKRIVELTIDRETNLQEIRRLESTITVKQRQYEKVINSIDTYTLSELQQYFTEYYPVDSLPSSTGN